MIVGLFGLIGRWLPLGPRLALRDSIRHRGRTAPAVAAVMAAVAGSVAVGIYSASSDQESRQAYVASAPRGAVTLAAGYGASTDLIGAQRSAVERSMTDLGPRADVLSVDYHGNCHVSGSNCGQLQLEVAPDKRCPEAGDSPYIPYSARNSTDPRCKSQISDYGSNFGSVIAGDMTVLHNLFALHDQGAEQAVAQGKVLVFDARFVKDGKVTFKLTEPYARLTGGLPTSGQAPEPPSHEVSADAVVVPLATPAAQAFVPPATATALGLTTSDGGSAWLPACDALLGRRAEGHGRGRQERRRQLELQDRAGVPSHAHADRARADRVRGAGGPRGRGHRHRPGLGRLAAGPDHPGGGRRGAADPPHALRPAVRGDRGDGRGARHDLRDRPGGGAAQGGGSDRIPAVARR